MPESRLIVGLGNPGGDYEYTRHNLGFLVVQRLAKKFALKFSPSSLTNGVTAEGVCEGLEICLLMPMTFMNHSGSAVRQVMSKKEFFPEQILVVCDDFNLDFEQIRLRAKGSDGGHNGLGSVIQNLDTEEFTRLRMGISQPPGKKDTVDYVLEEFTKKEKDQLDGFIGEAVSCCLMWLQEGVSVAMDQYNRRK